MTPSQYTEKVIAERTAYWQEKISAWSLSGQTQRDFCQQEGISLRSFSKWKLRIDQHRKGLIPSSLLAAEVIDSSQAPAVEKPSSGLEVVLPSGLCIRVPSDFLVAPLVAYMKAQVLLSKIIGTDDTPVPVMDAGGSRKGRLWAYLGDEEHPFDVFDYTRTRERDGPARFLEGFEGYLQADAYSGYDQLYAEGSVIEVGCWMHARRYFYEASRSEPARPCAALAMIRELFHIERRCKNKDAQQRYQDRQEHAVPILDTFEAWLQEQALLIPPKSPLGRAIGYAQRQWPALRRYTEDGALAIDNGRTERALRGIAIGRKNWLFAGSDAGGERAANIYSLIGTCKRHRVDPEAYLRDLLKLLPTHPTDRLDELTPMAWAKRQAALRAA